MILVNCLLNWFAIDLLLVLVLLSKVMVRFGAGLDFFPERA